AWRRVGRYRWVAQWAFPAWRRAGCGRWPYPGYAAGASPRVGRYRWVAQWAFPAWRGPGCGLRPYPGYAAARWALPARQGPGCSTKKQGIARRKCKGRGAGPASSHLDGGGRGLIRATKCFKGGEAVAVLRGRRGVTLAR